VTQLRQANFCICNCSQAKQQQLIQERRKQEEEKLLTALASPMGFHKGKPLAALVVFRACLQWRAFQADRTSVFDRIIQVRTAADLNIMYVCLWSVKLFKRLCIRCPTNTEMAVSWRVLALRVQAAADARCGVPCSLSPCRLLAAR
jgi:hypothetical protein